jgi:hypothetical protein
LLNLWLVKLMIRCINNGVTTIKPEHLTTRNTCVIWSDELSFMLFPASGRVYIWRTPKEAYNLECLVPTLKHGGGSVMVWAAISWYSILLVPCAAHPKNSTFLSKIDAAFLPANCTSQTQPLDMGIIQAFKCYYIKQLI